MPLYYPGQTVRLTTTFLVGSTPTDPTTVSLSVQSPAGTDTAYTYNPGTIVRDSAGVFHQDIVVSLAGPWEWTWTGTGTAAGVDQGSLTVERAVLGGNALCSVDDVKLRIESTNDADDDLIQSYIVAASATLPMRYEREFLDTTPETGGGTRTFRVGRYGYLVDLAPYDLRSGGTLTLHPEESAQTLTNGSDYMLLPRGGHPRGGTYLQVRLSGRLVLNSTLFREFGTADLRIVGDWGCFTGGAVDETVRHAAALTVASWLNRSLNEGFILDPGREMRPDMFVNYAVPSAAHALLTPWARIGTP